MMGPTLARRLGKESYFGMVIEAERDARFARIDVPYVLWQDIHARLSQAVS